MNRLHALPCLISIVLLAFYTANAREIKKETQKVNVTSNSNTNAYLNLKIGCYLLTEYNDSLLNMRSYSGAWESINKSNHTPIGFIVDSIVNETRHILLIYNFHEGVNLIIDSTGTVISIEGEREKVLKRLKVEIYQGSTIRIKQLETDSVPIVNGVYTFIGDHFEKYFISVLYDSVYKDTLAQRYSLKQNIFTFPNGKKYICEFGSDLVGDEAYFTGGLRMSPMLKADTCTYDLYKKNADYILYSNCDTNYSLILSPIK